MPSTNKFTIIDIKKFTDNIQVASNLTNNNQSCM